MADLSSTSSTAARPAALDLQHVSRHYGEGVRFVAALTDVSLSVEAGQLVAVMGPSGSGKSTLLNVAGLLQVPTGGRVLIDGVDASTVNRTRAAELRRDHIGVVFQHYNLVPTLSIAENITLPLELGGTTQHLQEAAEAALAEVGLEGFGERFPEEISGGQAQRVAIARALVGQRRLILADEPTGALDTTTGEEIMEVLRSRIDAGAAGLLVTHEPRFAAWADRVIVVRDGRIVDDGLED